MVIGTLMVVWPLVFVLVEDDLRRVLAYSLMIQIGLMVAAIGAGNAIALDGATLHVVMDVLFKMLLFMALGAVLIQAGTVRASELGGLAGRCRGPWVSSSSACWPIRPCPVPAPSSARNCCWGASNMQGRAGLVRGAGWRFGTRRTVRGHEGALRGLPASAEETCRGR